MHLSRSRLHLASSDVHLNFQFLRFIHTTPHRLTNSKHRWTYTPPALKQITTTHSSNSMSDESNDSYTPTPSPSPPPVPPPDGRTAQEWDRAKYLALELAFDNEDMEAIAETRLRLHAHRIVARPSTMDDPLSYTPASDNGPWLLDENLRVLSRPKDKVMYTNMATLNAYDHAIKRKIRVGEIKELIIHVLNFDFSLAIREIFSKFEPEARAFYQSRNTVFGSDKVKIWLTVTPEFTRQWYPSLLQKWLDWRDEERAAGRDFYILYAVSKSTKNLSMDELENFRQFLHFIDPDGDIPGDMGGIMKAYQGWYKAEFIRRGF
jgi:hypothetical protein